LGATLKNGIVADFITSGTLNANLINVTNLSADNIVSGVLSSQKGNATLDLSTGQLEFISQYGGDRKTTISDGNIVLGGITSKDYVFLHNNGIYFFDMNGEFTGFIDGWTEYGMRIHCLNADGLDTSIRALRWKQIGDDWVLVGVDPLNDPGV
jgi:hypothetical protein